MDARGLVVSLHEGAFFGSGDDKIIPASYPSIAKIADAFGASTIRCASKATPIPSRSTPPRFDSNWELSAARSIAMLNLLATKIYDSARALRHRRLRRDHAG